MLITTADRLELMLDARAEATRFRTENPPSAFHEHKLEKVWERASTAPAYAPLPPFSMETFRDHPITRKEDLKARPLDYCIVEPAEADKYYETTGTTGRPTPTPRLAEDAIRNAVSVAEAWRPLLGERDRVLVLLPSDVVPVGDLVVHVCEYLGAVHTRAYPFATGICDWDRLTQIWETLRPTVLYVAPGVAQQLTRLLKRRDQLAAHRASVEKIMLLGEVNTAPFRARLGAWWQAEVYDASYGSTETGTLATSCHAGRQHLLLAANHFELATADGVWPLRAGERGRLVVTPLNLHARPLLRLDTGDEVTLADDCRCGTAAPSVTVHGRSSDALVLAGAKVTVREVEEIVYGETAATGYLMEVDPEGRPLRLLLERDSDWDRGAEGELADAVQAASRSSLRVTWGDVRFVNALPVNTKSGASQKSWKRTNLRVVEAGS
ncbi:phenylacetate--CoA ligase family protein [Streptomyces millisiae]|uniref:AMP-binding protein n=1 Tax=Streptomyces millisiae TaxID=3075542 RepID=A0ABU2LID4_9ACTN|nr:AMP-binding protein [Streptomyces sp. DSM 44918]MDT0317351.1 AMP-binding protein [Streptomyces sp. DSM 44918]